MAKKLSHGGFHLKAFSFSHIPSCRRRCSESTVWGAVLQHGRLRATCQMHLVCRDLHHFVEQDRLQSVDYNGLVDVYQTLFFTGPRNISSNQAGGERCPDFHTQ